MGWAEYCVAYVGYANECGDQAWATIDGFWYCKEHASRMRGLETLAAKLAD